MQHVAETGEGRANRPPHHRSRVRLSLGCKAVLGLFALLAFLLGSCKISGPVVPMPPSQRGADLYAAHCAACHGSTGAGGGPGSKPTAASAPLRSAWPLSVSTCG